MREQATATGEGVGQRVCAWVGGLGPHGIFERMYGWTSVMPSAESVKVGFVSTNFWSSSTDSKVATPAPRTLRLGSIRKRLPLNLDDEATSSSDCLPA